MNPESHSNTASRAVKQSLLQREKPGVFPPLLTDLGITGLVHGRQFLWPEARSGQRARPGRAAGIDVAQALDDNLMTN